MLKGRNICTEYFSHLNSAYTNDKVYRGIKQEDKCQIPYIRVSTAEYFLYLRLLMDLLNHCLNFCLSMS